MSNLPTPEKKVETDYRKQIDDVYRKLAIEQKPEQNTQTSYNQKAESPFGTNSYYWFK